MNICLIMDNPETPYHPVIGVALQKLRATHNVRLLDVRTLTDAEAIAKEEQYTLADLYLLKSHAPQALSVAHVLEQKGALVINSWAASVACQDRVLMAQRMHEAKLPWPFTRSFSTLGSLLADREMLASLRTPLEPNAYKEDHLISPEELPDEWAHIAKEIGRVFNMRLYGVDLLMTERGPIIVDVNGFPGFRGVPGADRALVALVEHIAQERKA